MKQAALYWLPWPKGEIQSPPEAFVTRPTDWDADIATVESWWHASLLVGRAAPGRHIPISAG